MKSFAFVFPGQGSQSVGMLDPWGEHAGRGEAIDVAAEMMHVALQVVGKAMFSAEIGDQADELATATLTVLDHASRTADSK